MPGSRLILWLADTCRVYPVYHHVCLCNKQQMDVVFANETQTGASDAALEMLTRVLDM
jgi:hypothetical protein